jgi:hypothetical protein
MASAACLRAFFLTVLAAGLCELSQAAQAKLDLYRKNKALDKNPSRAARNVLCETRNV